MTTKHSPLIKLHAARRARDAHSEVCTSWDYESDGGCDECEENRRNVQRALAAYDKAFGRKKAA